MRRSFLSRTIICLIPTIIAAFLVGRAYIRDPEGFSGFKRGIDLSGGTILVYEVDQELSKINQSGPDDGERAKADSKLADALKRRIDPFDKEAIIIRPLGETRIEIILPTGGSTVQRKGDKQALSTGRIDEIKRTISEVGSLEFRILANTTDDAEAIREIEEFLADEANADLLKDRAKAGLPPPLPQRSPENANLVLNEPVRYEWVELGQHVRMDMGLSEVYPGTGRQGDQRATFKADRLSNRLHRKFVNSEKGTSESVYYSRDTVFARPDNKKPGDTAEAATKRKVVDYFVLTRVSPKDRLLVGGDVTITATRSLDQAANPILNFAFNSRGADRFFEITSRNAPTSKSGSGTIRELGIILDGYLISSPTINEGIREQGQISGSFTTEEVDRMVTLLRSGALPASLKPLPVSENTIGPTLGADTIRSGTRAVGIAFAAVLVFMVIYYRFAGVVATIALLANLLLTIGFMVGVDASFTLPGLAGIVLMLGMAVDANVLIYERVREERDRGMTLQTAIRNGYDRAFPTIIDTHLASIFTAIVLYVVGNDQLKGFGVSLTVGLVISLFTSLYMTRLFFDFWMDRKWLTQLAMLKLFSRPNIGFMKIRKQMFMATAIFTLVGLSLFLFRGQRGLNVDFVGGTAYGGQLSEPVDIGTLRDRLSEKRQQEKLAIKEVRETTDPSGKLRNAYEIEYTDGQRTIIALANAPEGNTKEEREAAVKARASVLADWSVEQIFTKDSSTFESKFFTVRSTEREPEIVQSAITRLMTNDEGKTLLNQTQCTVKQDGDSWILEFSTPVSKSFIITQLERQFQKELTDYIASDVFDVVVDEANSTNGQYSSARVNIIKDANEGIANLVAAENGLKNVFEAVSKEITSKPLPERLETFDGTLASETRSRALYAILASWIAILLYLWFRFGNWTFGAAAVICLIHDLCFALGAIAICHYVHDTMIGQVLGLQDFKIDLPTVAALLTLVGYSVNDTIVVFDRIKEVRGKNPALTEQMINDSVNQTLSRTVLAAFTTFLVVFVLYAFGGDGVHLFAFVMVVGIVVGTYSSIYIASPLLLLFGEGKAANQQLANQAANG
ncbi:MAG: protein translocase subunit SecD [Zavarzinella sp.]